MGNQAPVSAATVLRATLLAMTAGTNPVVEVEWAPAVTETPIADGRSAQLTLRPQRPLSPVRFFEPDGITALLKAIGVTLDQFRAKGGRKALSLRMTIVRQGNGFALTHVSR